MLHDFLMNNQEEIAARCRIKVGQRQGRSATELQLQNGVPLFLEQLIRTLRIEQSSQPSKSRSISGPSSGRTTFSEVSVSASQHGKDLLDLGLTVNQVVHDYGDLCQAITDLAIERDAPFSVEEFRTLNRCLDNAIAEAVTEFSYHRDTTAASENLRQSNERLGCFAHELRNLLGTATLAFSAAKAGNLSFTGATGSVLERTLQGLEKLIAATVEDVRHFAQDAATLDSFSVAEFISEIHAAASLSAAAYKCTLRAPLVDPELALVGTRQPLIGAVANLLQNAFKFTHPNSEVLLTAYASGDRILIEVQDRCGGLGHGVADTMFSPFSQAGINRTGIGLGLTIAKQSVEANGGTLTVHDLPDVGCVFTINLSRHHVLT